MRILTKLANAVLARMTKTVRVVDVELANIPENRRETVLRRCLEHDRMRQLNRRLFSLGPVVPLVTTFVMVFLIFSNYKLFVILPVFALMTIISIAAMLWFSIWLKARILRELIRDELGQKSQS
jgi:hypothetical protein